MKDRSDYEQAIEIIGRVIRAWDPYCLLAEGAPADEFDAEITKITAKVPEFHSSSDTAQAISNVFSASFGSGQRFSPVDCSEAAHQIFQESGRANLLPTA